MAESRRWETYGGIEVEVPAEWGFGNSEWPSCVVQPPFGYVGRPGGIPLVGCRDDVPPLADRVPYLWFSALPKDPAIRSYDGGWVEESQIVAGVRITVLTDDDTLRSRLFASARPVLDDTDCPARHRILDGIEARPDPGLTGMGPVESVTICRYFTGNRPTNPVLSLSRVTGETAARLVRAILSAPEGSGPNTPGNCVPEVMYGDEAQVLVVRDGVRRQEVFVRYSGCDAHGFDDGHTRRWLTADALEVLLAGPHRPSGGLQSAVARLRRPSRFDPPGHGQ
ncbi:hypothetical protein DMH04_00400 [Kibdelosporangium aridum]|uniref:Uncharacterized protein n=1 Tax=Kibdelosporangium aridum TaxID=2030 RepID=A0A428ZU58_KIBAR|nr:hypothetical protein [Kibdelosporangium aridum]RSM91503.1 hypothetical protein DMH04_00400 [Kibdelosporangium aridum]